MKRIDKDKLKKLCGITKLHIDDTESDKYLDLLNSSLESLEKLDSVDTDGLEPLSNPYSMILQGYPDIVSDGDKVDEIMKATPKQLYNYFVVPKVINQ
ncbi:MAG: Asp-tRNA(Asn)/Glu-tRNA(Gln) amidotransferase subunit GatC [Rickettsiales bacterium]|jgi:aspartyl-tRNA(Asn)/glutamyl-tRNA(Gln) amidotransferase subunit C|nr:Asp-tRNA(Asn)/Glu-tRNA(Gln) amidotransferase subunit GatC [Rickettsiales bacterium]